MSTFNRRQVLTAGAALSGIGILAACGSDSGAGNAGSGGNSAAGETTKLRVGASPVPHARILEFVRAELAEAAGIEIDIKEYTDYILPNKDLHTKDLEANFYQTVPYLATETEANGYEFTAGAGIHVEPLGLYPGKAKSLEEITQGAEIAIPNDPTNRGRALALIADAGLISLDSSAGQTGASQEQITDNPLSLVFTELEGAMIPRTLNDFAAGVINGNYALEAGLSPAKNALHVEPGEGNPNANLLVWRTEDDGNAAIAKLEELLHSDEVRKFIEDTWTDGSVIPAF